MKSLHTAALFLITCITITPLHAESTLPAKEDREGWNRLIDLFAECSAVYNIAATVKEAPEKGGATYRELANNALVAGIFSAQQIGLSDSYLESIYTVKYRLWEASTTDKTQAGSLLAKAEQCIADSLATQDELLGTIRDHSAQK